MQVPSGTILVLPSPKGSTLCLMGGGVTIFTACLRNCRALADPELSRTSRSVPCSPDSAGLLPIGRGPSA